MSSEAGPSTPPSLKSLAKLPRRAPSTTLNRDEFAVRIPILSVRVPSGNVGSLQKDPAVRKYLMDIPKARGVLPDLEDSGLRLLRLRVKIDDDLPLEVKAVLEKQGSRGYVPDTIELDYSYWNASEILNSIIPTAENDDAPSSFAQTGHIGHVNLRDEYLPYKHLIGQVILDKNPTLRTVVNKLNTIHAVYRYFDMEVIAGEDDFVTTVNEATCSFTFDFRHVYWNSRLHHEHERLVKSFAPGEVVADAMAGVGPFAVPAAKKGCYVLGNDLNPEGVKWMRVNREKNHVEDYLRVYEADGRAFIQSAAKDLWDQPFEAKGLPLSKRQRERVARAARTKPIAPGSGTADVVNGISSLAVNDSPSVQPEPANVTPNSPGSTPQKQWISHFVLNLPDSALTFLDAFVGCYSTLTSLLPVAGIKEDEIPMPLIHVYCFTRFLDSTDAGKDICERATEYLHHPIAPDVEGYHLHLVRSVAPNKDMYCLTFRLPRTVAFARPIN